jgi:hypothetical protein
VKNEIPGPGYYYLCRELFVGGLKEKKEEEIDYYLFRKSCIEITRACDRYPCDKLQ